MKPILIAEGRAALQFPYEGDWGQTQAQAFYGASRPNILKAWKHMPRFIREDQGFQCLMDMYCPVDDETLQIKRQQRNQMAIDYLRSALGNAFKPTDEITDEEIIAALKAIPQHNACVDTGLPFGGVTALATNSTSRTVAGLKPRANQSVRMWGFDIGFDGTTSTNGPGIVEIQQNTWATNAPGTNSTSVTPLIIDFARPETVQTSGAKAWTTEPTAITTVEVFFIPNYMGSGIVFTPLTKPFGLTGTIGGSMRITQQSGITGNATGTLKDEERCGIPQARFGGGEKFYNGDKRLCNRPESPNMDEILI